MKVATAWIPMFLPWSSRLWFQAPLCRAPWVPGQMWIRGWFISRIALKEEKQMHLARPVTESPCRTRFSSEVSLKKLDWHQQKPFHYRFTLISVPGTLGAWLCPGLPVFLFTDFTSNASGCAATGPGLTVSAPYADSLCPTNHPL